MSSIEAEGRSALMHCEKSLMRFQFDHTEPERENDLTTLQFKSGQYDALVQMLKTGLNEAKREQGTHSQSQIAQCAHDVSKMSDIVIMAIPA